MTNVKSPHNQNGQKKIFGNEATTRNIFFKPESYKKTPFKTLSPRSKKASLKRRARKLPSYMMAIGSSKDWSNSIEMEKPKRQSRSPSPYAKSNTPYKKIRIIKRPNLKKPMVSKMK